jgi:hypothetical protein
MKSIGFGLGFNKPIPESHPIGVDELPSDYETDLGKFIFQHFFDYH